MLLNRLVSFGLGLFGINTNEPVDQAVALRSRIRMAHNFVDTLEDGTCYNHDITSTGLEYDDADCKIERAILSQSFQNIAEGSNVATNSGFDTDLTGWTVTPYDIGNGTPNGTVTQDGGQVLFTAGSVYGGLHLSQSFTTIIGRTYKIRCTVVSSDGGFKQAGCTMVIRARKGPAGNPFAAEIYDLPGSVAGIEPEAAGTFEYEFVATTTTTFIMFESWDDTEGNEIRIDDLECIEAEITGAKGTIDIEDNRITWAGDCTFCTWFKLDGPADADKVAYLIRREAEMAVKLEDGGDGAFYARAYDGTETVDQHVESPGLNYGTWYLLWLVKSGSTLTMQVNNWSEVVEEISAITETANPVYIAETLNQNDVSTALRMESAYFWRRALSVTERQEIWQGGTFLQFPFENSLHYGHIGSYDEDTWNNQHGSLANATGHIDDVGDQPLPAIVTDPTGLWETGRKVFSADAGYGARACVTLPQAAGDPYEVNFWCYATMVDQQSYDGEVYNPIVSDEFAIYYRTGPGWNGKFLGFGVTDSVPNAIGILSAEAYLDRWVNFSVSYDGDWLRIYADKRVIGSWQVGASNIPPDLVKMCYGKPDISGTALYTTQFNFWNRALNSQERTDIFNGGVLFPWQFNVNADWCTVENESGLADGLIHFWGMQEQSGNAEPTTGTLNLVPSGDVEASPGINDAGSARYTYMDGKFLTDANVQELENFTLAGFFWCDVDAGTPGYEFPLMGGESAGSNIIRAYSPLTGNHIHFKFGDMSHDAGFSSEWKSCIITNDQVDGLKMYVAGVEVSSSPTPIESVSAQKYVAIWNKDVTPTDYHDRRFHAQNLAIWNRAITAAEALEYHNSGAGWTPDEVVDRWATAGSDKAVPGMISWYGFEDDLTDEYGNDSITEIVTAVYSSTAKFGTKSLHVDGTVNVARNLTSYTGDPNDDEALSVAAWVRWTPDAGAGDKYVTVLRYSKSGDTSGIYVRFFKNDTKHVIQFYREDSGGDTFLAEKTVVSDTWYFVGWSIHVDGRLMMRFNNEQFVTKAATFGDLADGWRLWPCSTSSEGTHDGDSDAYVDGLVFGKAPWVEEDFNHLYDDFAPETGLTFETWATAGAGETAAGTLAAKMTSVYAFNSNANDSAGDRNLRYSGTLYGHSPSYSVGKFGNAYISDGYYFQRVAMDRMRSVVGWGKYDTSQAAANPVTANFGGLGAAYSGRKIGGSYVSFWHEDSPLVNKARFYDGNQMVDRDGVATENTWHLFGISQRDDGRLLFRFNDEEYITRHAVYLAWWQFKNENFPNSATLDVLSYIDDNAYSAVELTTEDFNRIYNGGTGRAYPYT